MATLYCFANIAFPDNNVKKYIFHIVNVSTGIGIGIVCQKKGSVEHNCGRLQLDELCERVRVGVSE